MVQKKCNIPRSQNRLVFVYLRFLSDILNLALLTLGFLTWVYHPDAACFAGKRVF